MAFLKRSVYIFLALLSASYILTTIYLALKIHVHLPSADLHANTDFLFNAHQHLISLDVLKIYNFFHWIVIPMSLYGLDMYLTGGNGWLVKGTCISTFLMSLLIIVLMINKTPDISVSQKRLLAFLACGLLGGPWIIESLINPISQYALLCFFLVCSAYFVSNDENNLLNKLGFYTSITLLLMCSGQLLALLPALLLVKFKSHLPRIIVISIGAVIFALVIDTATSVYFGRLPYYSYIFIWRFDQSYYGELTVEYLKAPLSPILGFIDSIFYFLSKLTFTQVFEVVRAEFLKLAGLFIYSLMLLLLLKYKPRWVGENFWLFSFVFCLITALLAGGLRSADGYSNRFANIGCLLLVSMCMYFVLFKKGKYTNWVISCMAIYLLSVAHYNYRDIEPMSKSLLAGSAMKAQLAYSVGIKNPNLIVSAPWGPWAKDVADEVLSFSPEWEANNLGVYSTKNYKIYSGLLSLPDNQKKCEYKIENYVWYENAEYKETVVYIQGTTMASTSVTQLAFYDSEGQAIGRAIEDTGKSLGDMLFKPSSWHGYVKLPQEKHKQITAVAYGRDFHCQSYITSLQHK